MKTNIKCCDLALRSDIKGLSFFLQNHPDCDLNQLQESFGGMNPLMLAVRNGQIDCVKMLLKHKADVNVSVDGGWNPIMWAIRAGGVEMVNILLEAGADITVKTLGGWSLVHLAIFQDNDECLNILFERGLDIKCSDSLKLAPLFFAASMKALNCFKFLLERGIDMSYENQHIIDYVKNLNYLEFLPLIEAEWSKREAQKLAEDLSKNPYKTDYILAQNKTRI